MGIQRSSVHVEAILAAVLLLVFVGHEPVRPSDFTSRNTFMLLFRFTETLACSIGILVLSSNVVRHWSDRSPSWFQVGISVTILGVASLTFQLIPLPDIVQAILFVSVVAFVLVLVGLRFRQMAVEPDSSVHLGLFPAIEIGLIAPFLIFTLWSPWVFVESVVKDVTGYRFALVLIPVVICGLIALPAPAISLVGRAVQGQSFSRIEVGSYSVTVVTLTAPLFLINMSNEFWVWINLLFGPIVVIVSLALYVIFRLRGLSSRGSPDGG